MHIAVNKVFVNQFENELSLWFPIAQDIADELSTLNQASDTLADTQQSKYDALQVAPPPEVAEEIEKLRIQQARFAETMERIEKSLSGAEVLRRDFYSNLKRVEEVVEGVTEVVQDTVTDVPESKRATEVCSAIYSSISRLG